MAVQVSIASSMGAIAVFVAIVLWCRCVQVGKLLSYARHAHATDYDLSWTGIRSSLADGDPTCLSLLAMPLRVVLIIIGQSSTFQAQPDSKSSFRTLRVASVTMSKQGRIESGVWCNDEEALLNRQNSGRSAEASGRAGQQTGHSRSWDSFPPSTAEQESESLAVLTGPDVLELGQSEHHTAQGKSREGPPASDVLLLSNDGPVLPAAVPATSSPSRPQGATMHLRPSQRVESTTANR